MFHKIGAKLCLILTLLPLCLCPAFAQTTAPQSCTLKTLASMDFRTDTHGLISVPVKVEDRDGFFLVDTGAAGSLIDPLVAKAMGIKSRHSDVRYGGIADGWTDVEVNPKNFAIGQMHASNLWFYAFAQGGKGIIGTLGPNLLRNFDLDFDFAAGKLNLISPDHCPGQVVYWSSAAVATVPITIGLGGHTEIPVTVDGNNITAVVDSGSSLTLLGWYAAKRYLHLSPQDPAIIRKKMVINGHNLDVDEYPFKGISFAGVTISNPYVIILQDRDAINDRLILGMTTLRQLHLYIAYKERAMYVTSATAH